MKRRPLNYILPGPWRVEPWQTEAGKIVGYQIVRGQPADNNREVLDIYGITAGGLGRMDVAHAKEAAEYRAKLANGE
jgi:hypothetical protein